MKKILITFTVFTIMILNMTVVTLADSELAQKEFGSDFEAVRLDAADNNVLTFDNCYPVYYYSDVKGVEYEDTFISHLDDYPTWRFSDGKWEYIYYFDTELKKWKLESTMATIPNYPDENGEPLSMSLNALADIVEEKIEGNIDDFKIVLCENALCLYALIDGEEKIVYYSKRPDINNLENGKVYPASEIIKNAYATGSAPSDVYTQNNELNEQAAVVQNNNQSDYQDGDNIVMKPEMYGGGSGGTIGIDKEGDKTDNNTVPTVPTDEPDYTVYIIFGVGALVLVAAVVTLALLRKKR